MKNILRRLGLLKSNESYNNLPCKIEEYTQSEDIEKIRMHKDYLRLIEKDENERLNQIENKTSQLLSQTSIIFSLLSFFIPLLIDKISDENLFIKIAFLFILLIAFGAYGLTIHHAIKNYNVKKFVYSRPGAQNVIKYQSESSLFFIKMEVNDLLESISLNVSTNNKKASNLIFSFRTFKIANITTSVLVLVFCYSVLFVSNVANQIDHQDSINMGRSKETQKVDSLNEDIVDLNIIKQRIDSETKTRQFLNDTLGYSKIR